MSKEYMLNRDTAESHRLNVQHQVYVKSLGYVIKPSVASSLPRDAKIADIGTGTGVWAITAAAERPSSHCTGFDLSDAQFPPKDSLPNNITLTTHDLREPFPQAVQGTFDLVHLRLLCLAMPDQDAWNAATKNIATLLKPGSWLQWEEAEISATHFCAREHASSSITAMTFGFNKLLTMGGESLQSVPEKLRKAFSAADLTDTDMNVVSTERLRETRGPACEIGLNAFVSMHRYFRSVPELAATMPGTAEDDEKLMGEMMRDMESGGYNILFVHCLTGRKAS